MDREFKVGLTITILLGILIFGYLWLTNFKIRQRKHYYFIRFKEVGWIKKGDPVTVLGVPTGKVEDVKLYPDSVVVKISLNNFQLTEGSIAYIEPQGIIGQMRISLKLGHGKVLKDYFTIEGIKRKDLADVMAFIGEAGDSLIALIQDLRRTLKRIDTASLVLQLEVKHFLRKTSRHMDSLMVLLAQEREDLDSTHVLFNKLLADYDTVAIIMKLGRGSLIRFIQSDTLYMRADSILMEIQRLIQDIKQHPKKYFKISIF